MRTENPKTIFLKEYTPPLWQVDSIDLDIDLHKTKTLVRSRLQITPLQTATSNTPLVLDGEELTLKSIRLNGEPLSEHDYELTTIALSIKKPPQTAFVLEIENTCNPEANTTLSGLYLTEDIYCTQCEAEGFRRITYFLDRPDVLSKFTTRITAAKAEVPVLLSNGNLIEHGDLENGRHFAYWQDPFPKPSYLFALVAGNLACVKDSFTTMTARTVDLRIYVEPGHQNRCGFALESLKKAMTWDEQRFGREYDLDIFMIVAVSAFNMGAMENKGLNIFNDKYILAQPDSATDTDYATIESIIGHEYFHNWTGNRITCRDWFQLCLKEGLTVFRDQEFTADVRSPGVKRIEDVRMLRTHQFPEDSGPLAHSVRPDSYMEINNFYTATVYEKGAEVIRMLQTLIGRETFRKAMDLYFDKHDGCAATVEDFLECMSQASGLDLDPFALWYAQSGTPELTVTGTYEPRKKTYRLTLTQITPATADQSEKASLHIPVEIGLIGADGRDMPLIDATGATYDSPVLSLSEHQQTFHFSEIKTRPVLSVLRGFTAPVKLTTNQKDHDLLFLIAHDGDMFNRWQAAQAYATTLLLHTLKALDNATPHPDSTAFASAIDRTLKNTDLEPGFLAQFLSLPSETDIIQSLAQNADPDTIHNARSLLQTTIATQLHDTLLGLYQENAQPGPYSSDAPAAGKRALRNRALTLLTWCEGEQHIIRAQKHFETADNMTDKMAALNALKRFDHEIRDQALQDFHDQYQSNPLVLDKWFTLHATTPHPKTIDKIHQLQSHKHFSLKNPNRVRALIGAFTTNLTCFHAPDAAGYDLVIKTVLSLDKINPQVAARMLGAFKSWRLLEPTRRGKARQALEQVAKAPGLSRDLYEIATKSLH